MTEPLTADDMEDWFVDVISDSLEMDWHPRDAARLILFRMNDEGISLMLPTPRGTECPSSPTGYHIVDTSMESGPNNCFHCEGKMP